MLKLTRSGEYAVKGMIFLAGQPPGQSILIGDIAHQQQVSPSFLAKIFQSLSGCGLVDSRRGAGGGVSLGKPATDINLRMIIEAVDGPVALNNCLSTDSPCTQAGQCPVAGVWRRAQDGMMGVLESCNLAELARHPTVM